MSLFRINFSATVGRVLLAGAVFCAVAGAVAGERVQITILSTTDLHGHIGPMDDYSRRPAQSGLAKIATLVKQVRQETPNVILLDSGDTIQGSPLAYHHNRINNAPPDPMMLAMNALGYDAMAVGNHEYNFGLAVLGKARSEAAFPWLSGNTFRTGGEETAFAPYAMKDVAGVRVAIIGLTTAGIPNWEDERNYAGLEFRDAVTAAKRWVAVVRERERADVVVIAMHMGLERDLATGTITPGQVEGENAAMAVAEQVPGVDVILMGHTHREVPSATINGVLLTQANKWGERLARADVVLEKETGGRWRVTGKSSRTLIVDASVPPDAEIMKLAEPYNLETQAWLNQSIGESAKELLARESRVKDTAMVDLIHRVQLDVGRADVSFAASFSLSARLPEGPVTVRDLYSLYVFENTLVVVEATGAQVRAALEFSAGYFREFEPGRTASELINPGVPGYNFDMAEGVDYELDLTRPVGDRVVNLKFEGEPLAPDRKLRVAINNYRLNGGGGYTMFHHAPELYRSSEEIRNLILDWVRAHHTIPSEPTNNWRIRVGH